MSKEDMELMLNIFPKALLEASVQNALKEFFDQNAVIKRDENRHPYADVCIKPQEPVYEWQWYLGNFYGVTGQFYTDEEMEGKPFIKIEQTKRERTQ